MSWYLWKGVLLQTLILLWKHNRLFLKNQQEKTGLTKWAYPWSLKGKSLEGNGLNVVGWECIRTRLSFLKKIDLKGQMTIALHGLQLDFVVLLGSCILLPILLKKSKSNLFSIHLVPLLVVSGLKLSYSSSLCWLLLFLLVIV
jgi:hypothetical protein